MTSIPNYPELHYAVIQEAPHTVVVKQIPTPQLAAETDCIVKAHVSALCGSDLHIYRGHQAGPYGYVMGHEFAGEIVKIGAAVKNFKLGDRVVSPFTTSCGSCFFCLRQLTCRCIESQLFGSKTLEGAQAEFVRVPLADTTLFLSPPDISDENLVLMADILPTGYFAAKSAWSLLNDAERPNAVAVVIGCGPVGLCAITAATERFSTVYAIDSVPERLQQAKDHGAIPLDLNDSPSIKIHEATSGRGADAVLEIVGSPDALLLAIELARAGGVVVSCGVHTHEINMPGSTLYNKNLRFQFGRCPARALFAESLELLRKVSKASPALFDNFVQKRVTLKDAPEYYKLFDERKVGKTVFIGSGF